MKLQLELGESEGIGGGGARGPFCIFFVLIEYHRDLALEGQHTNLHFPLVPFFVVCVVGCW